MPASVGYVPSQMDFTDAESEVDEWYALPSGVRERLTVPPGDEHVHWWATKHNAAMFRRRRLVLAESRVTSGSRRWHVYSYDLDPSSIKVYESELPAPKHPRDASDPAPDAGRTTKMVGRTWAPPPVFRPEGTAPLPETMRGYLGNLPFKAQQFLQLPFSQATVTPTTAYSYRFHGTSAAPILTTMCLLANKGQATFMFAERHLPTDTPRELAWSGEAPWHVRLYFVRGRTHIGGQSALVPFL